MQVLYRNIVVVLKHEATALTSSKNAIFIFLFPNKLNATQHFKFWVQKAAGDVDVSTL